MANANGTSSPDPIEILGTYASTCGARVQIPIGQAYTYAGIKVEQLKALLHSMIGSEFHGASINQKNAITMLAMSIAEELDNLIELVSAEASIDASARKGGA